MKHLIVFAVFLSVAVGCSISNSVQSSSDSSNNGSRSSANSSDSSTSSSDSSSSSSGGAPEAVDEAYRNDIRDYTRDYFVAAEGFAGFRFGAFQKGLSEIARRHGIANWEVRRATWRGMGAGFAGARATQEQLDHVKQSLAATSPEQQQDLQSGYESVI